MPKRAPLPPRTPQRAIRDELVARCAVRGWTQKQLADMVGISASTVNTDWQDPSKITLGRLLRYMTALDVGSMTLER